MYLLRSCNIARYCEVAGFHQVAKGKTDDYRGCMAEGLKPARHAHPSGICPFTFSVRVAAPRSNQGTTPPHRVAVQRSHTMACTWTAHCHCLALILSQSISHQCDSCRN